MNKLTKYACILTTLAGAVACSGGKKAQGDYAIIPLPQEVVTQGSAPFLLKPSTPISYQEGDAEMEQTARFLASYVKEATGYEPKVITGNADKGIHLSIASDIRNPEGYRLLVSENGIEIAGASNAGIFYGVQTLRKSIPAVAEGMDIELPAASINDYPRFPVSRYAPRCFPALLPGRFGQEVHRYSCLAQYEPLPLAPDRRPGMAHRDQEISGTDPDRGATQGNSHRP